MPSRQYKRGIIMKKALDVKTAQISVMALEDY
jgi:hypothetical protein